LRAMLKRYTSECRFGPALAAALALSLCLASRAGAADASCEAFSLSAAAAGAGAGPAAGALDTPGVQPAAPPRLDPKLVQNQGVDGAIIRIPEGRQSAVMNRASGEALLVLPKLPSGKLADDFTLGAGAKIVDSFWSPVLCATLVRVRGPRDATPQDLVPRVAPPALVLPHSRYRTSAAKVRAADPPKTQGPDPYLPFQLGLAQLGVMQARGRTDGRGVRVALLDSAPDVRHRELARVRMVPLEAGPPAAPPHPGTLMAGLIAAIESNAFGIVGVAPGADLIAIPVCTPVGDGTSDECDLYDVLRGIDEAWKQEATILNLSLAGPPDPLLQRAVTRLLELGAVVVAAAGNGSSSLPAYPAAYRWRSRSGRAALRARKPRPLGLSRRPGRRGALHHAGRLLRLRERHQPRRRAGERRSGAAYVGGARYGAHAHGAARDRARHARARLGGDGLAGKRRRASGADRLRRAEGPRPELRRQRDEPALGRERPYLGGRLSDSFASSAVQPPDAPRRARGRYRHPEYSEKRALKAGIRSGR